MDGAGRSRAVWAVAHAQMRPLGSCGGLKGFMVMRVMGSEDARWGWRPISTHQLALSMHPERRRPVRGLDDDSKAQA